MRPVMRSGAEEIVAKRKDRCIATILGVKERDCDGFLSDEAQYRLRKVVLDQINEFADLALDVIRGLDDGRAVFNEEYFARLESRLEEIHRAVV